MTFETLDDGIKGDPWIAGRNDAERGRAPASDLFDYMNGYTSPRLWTETWEAYVERRKPYTSTRP